MNSYPLIKPTLKTSFDYTKGEFPLTM